MKHSFRGAGRSRWSVGLVSIALFVSLAGCGGSGSGGAAAPGTTGKPALKALEVGPGKTYTTIQKAVDAAKSGDLILISPGTYKEAVVVETDDIVVRGLDRTTVVIDGEFTRDNGIKVLANGVAVENLTVRNHKGNGLFFTGEYNSESDNTILNGYRASYITAINNGDYGIYAFNATRGQFDHVYGSGHPDSAFYIGQCNPCDAVLIDSIGENNFLGYSGTNSTGVKVVNNVFRQNRIGISPQSQDGEKEPPNDGGLIAGNDVYDNNNPDTPQKDDRLDLAFGTGIVLGGTNNYVVSRNRVVDNKRAGIVIILWPFGTIFDPHDNQVVDNEAHGAEEYGDLVLGLADTAGGALGNCFGSNDAVLTRPVDIETVAGCGKESSKGFEPVDVAALAAGAPPYADYKTIKEPPAQPSMPDAATAPAVPAGKGWSPIAVDLAKITRPTGSSGATTSSGGSGTTVRPAGTTVTTAG